MSKKLNVPERLYPKINGDKNKVYLPNGVWADWSMYGKNAEDAIDYYNDAKDVENVGIMIGSVLTAAVIGGISAIRHLIKKKKAKKQEKSEKTEEEA